MARTPRKADVRKEVYAAVRRYPGIHVRGLERELGVSAQLAQYHLRRLEDAGFVVSREQGGYARYYPTGKGEGAPLTDEDWPLVGLLREEVPLHIVLVLLDEGPLPHGEITRRVDVAKSTLSYHLAKLAHLGIVERVPGTPQIRLADPDRIHRLLLAYAPTPDLLTAFSDLWDDLYG